MARKWEYRVTEPDLPRGATSPVMDSQQMQQWLNRLPHAVLDVAAHLLELLLVDDGADVGRLVERIANLELRDLGSQSRQEIVEYVGMQKEARTGSA